ncbi:N-acetylglucosaminyldiphospho-UDP N-acetyl-beta-D-mannosaminyltransferase [Sulfuricella sp. T08]|uniref:WecB/TagA/CpsF family glycosyltransferase n=1 Tax=Sulfuricella sp. T08 TaxID=1632857 RepID=UPI0006179CB4|nr:WecB/TagA/CpsF family glycosyltransferase [Sulfuricella sp. T08]GAO34684.1 N-acetylglucosaminyldiphospho-UDP N-acetyl-beta-D-mannosaminyltransferase [Sulfuricella sp. T08]
MVDFNRDIHCLLGLPFDAVTMAEAVGRVHRAVSDGQRCFLSTPNLSFLIGCLADRGFRDSVINSDLSIADGMPLVWMARMLGIPIRERVAGSGVFEALRCDSAQGMSVYFFGGPEGVAERACQKLTTDSAGMTCVGHECPGFGSIDDMSSESVIARINASGADFLVVALGAKKGQAWIVRNRARITVPIISHLGAVVNFVAGTVRRAPVWMQRSGLEWLWRIKEEPGLWRRYFEDGMALLTLLVTRVVPYVWYLQHHKADADQLAMASVETREEGQSYIVRLQGAWTQRNIAPLRDCFSNAVLAGKDVRLEMGGVTYVDSAFVGLVILLQGYQTQHCRQLLLASLQQPVHRIIKYCCAEYLLKR